MVIRAQIAVQKDSLFPADALMMTPHFEVAEGVIFGGADAEQLAHDLADGIDTWDTTTSQVRVKVYDAQSPAPNFPLGEWAKNVGAAPASSGVREVALCLSFYASLNRPRQRGRLFVPASLAQISTANPRPLLASRQKVADLVPIFAGLGGANVDWVVFSRADNEARKVTNWWVDDAWDIQRSRGLLPSARLEGTTGG
jgi:hypothetical protein